MVDINKLVDKYPFLKKSGEIHHGDLYTRKILRKYRQEKLLILMIGVQGSGKTTYCEKNFPKQYINIDSILKEYLRSNEVEFTEEVDIEVHQIFFDKIHEDLEKGLAVIDANCLDLNFRVNLLNRLQGEYTKAIFIVLNPALQRIRKQINGQIAERARPGLWEEVELEYGFLQIEIEEGIIAMGADEVFFV